MDDHGQMIILSALLACICLLGIVACMAALNDGAYASGHDLNEDGLANICWAQESALRRAAAYYSSAWADRAYAISGFKGSADASAGNTSMVLLKHGVFYRFTFNDSLATECVSAHPGNGWENIGGVIVERNDDTARIKGCAYDMEAQSRGLSYRLSKIVYFV